MSIIRSKKSKKKKSLTNIQIDGDQHVHGNIAGGNQNNAGIHVFYELQEKMKQLEHFIKEQNRHIKELNRIIKDYMEQNHRAK